MAACGARTRNGGLCQSRAMPNGRCRMHGGSTPSGIASPHYKTGRYAKHMPKRMLETYEQARTDPELLNLSDDLAMVEARISDVLARVDSGEAGEAWEKLADAWNVLRIAQKAKDGPQTHIALATIGQIIDTGSGDWAAWREVFDLVERRRKLVMSEVKRRIQMQDMTDNAEVMIAVDKLVDAVVRHVSDRDALRAIQRELESVLGTRECH